MKPLLIGMNNPVMSGIKYVFYPHPPGCAGWRLLQFINLRTPMRRREYLEKFDRINLVDGKKWSRFEARSRARDLFEELRGPRDVVAVGREVQTAFAQVWPPIGRLDPLENIFDATTDILWHYMPHPSGLNRWFNREENQYMAAEFLVGLAIKEREE